MKLRTNQFIPLFQIPFNNYHLISSFNTKDSLSNYLSMNIPLIEDVDLSNYYYPTVKYSETLSCILNISGRTKLLDLRGIYGVRSKYGALFYNEKLIFTLAIDKDFVPYVRKAYEAKLKFPPELIKAYVCIEDFPKIGLWKSLKKQLKAKFGDIEIVELSSLELTNTFFFTYQEPKFLALQQRIKWIKELEDGWKQE